MSGPAPAPSAWRGRAITLLLLALLWPAWLAGGAVVAATGLYVLDLPIRAGLVLALVCLLGEALERWLVPPPPGAGH